MITGKGEAQLAQTDKFNHNHLHIPGTVYCV